MTSPADMTSPTDVSPTDAAPPQPGTSPVERRVENYYSARIRQHGASPAGVDWRDEHSQFLRFAQLLRIAEGREAFSINDMGCGYGALLDYLNRHHPEADYLGYDLSAAMIEHAQARYPAAATQFFCGGAAGRVADFAVASGLLNVRQDVPIPDWEAFIAGVLDRLHEESRYGFAFNSLTLYSDPERMRPDLYYADPCRLFDTCKRRYSRHVALLHDYGLYEFTLLVRKDGTP